MWCLVCCKPLASFLTATPLLLAHLFLVQNLYTQILYVEPFVHLFTRTLWVVYYFVLE
jgi:hypothetical protein